MNIDKIEKQTTENIRAKANLIWEIATHLVGLYKPHEYGKVILPMTVLKRFDDVLELIQFIDSDISKVQSDLFKTSISEICFYTDDIDFVYKKFKENNVEYLSAPQNFDFSADGFGKSRAFYFRDPDGIILEMMQPV